jgi:hypothetical protein
VDDHGYFGMFSIWLALEDRWVTVWDFLRHDEQGLEDALPVFNNPGAAKAAIRRLPAVVRPHCVVRCIVVDPPDFDGC